MRKVKVVKPGFYKAELFERFMDTEKRFQMLLSLYDSGQEELPAKIKELEKSTIADREQLSSIEQFTEQTSGYAMITELNFKITSQLIEKILVSEPIKADGQKIQHPSGLPGILYISSRQPPCYSS